MLQNIRLQLLKKKAIQIQQFSATNLEYDLPVKNEKLGQVQLTKVDKDNVSLKLQGAVFTLEKLNTTTGQYETMMTRTRARKQD